MSRLDKTCMYCGSPNSTPQDSTLCSSCHKELYLGTSHSKFRNHQPSNKELDAKLSKEREGLKTCRDVLLNLCLNGKFEVPCTINDVFAILNQEIEAHS